MYLKDSRLMKFLGTHSLFLDVHAKCSREIISGIEVKCALILIVELVVVNV